MGQVVDLISTINERVVEFFYTKRLRPYQLVLSPAAYRKLAGMNALEVKRAGPPDGTPEVGEISTPLGKLRVCVRGLMGDAEMVLS